MIINQYLTLLIQVNYTFKLFVTQSFPGANPGFVFLREGGIRPSKKKFHHRFFFSLDNSKREREREREREETKQRKKHEFLPDNVCISNTIS
jgi:hypothetical protein